jgi:cytochrome c2
VRTALSILRLVAAVVLANAAKAEAEDGARLFQRCYACHSIEPGEAGLPGPNLAGVVGRRAAALDGFDYSEAARAAGSRGLVWDPEALDAFLADPVEYLPGTLMSFPGLKSAADRAAIVDFLKSHPAAAGKS